VAAFPPDGMRIVSVGDDTRVWCTSYDQLLVSQLIWRYHLLSDRRTVRLSKGQAIENIVVLRPSKVCCNPSVNCRFFNFDRVSATRTAQNHQFIEAG